jgi:thioredoxin 1
MTLLNVTDGTFDAEVLRSELPVLVDFWAPWCGPCRLMLPTIEALATQLDGRARFVKVNVDDARATAARFGITSIPSFMVFHGGDALERFSGVIGKERLLAVINSLPG